MESGTSSVVELGRFLTGFLVIMGIGTYCRTPMVIPMRTRTCELVLDAWCMRAGSQDHAC